MSYLRLLHLPQLFATPSMRLKHTRVIMIVFTRREWQASYPCFRNWIKTSLHDSTDKKLQIICFKKELCSPLPTALMPLPSKEKTPCICQLALCLCLLSRQKLQAWALGWVFGPAIVCMIYWWSSRHFQSGAAGWKRTLGRIRGKKSMKTDALKRRLIENNSRKAVGEKSQITQLFLIQKSSGAFIVCVTCSWNRWMFDICLMPLDYDFLSMWGNTTADVWP